MRVYKKILIGIGIVLLITAIGGYLYLNNFVQRKLENFLETRLADNISVEYNDLEVSTITGSVLIKDITVIFRNEADSIVHTRVAMEKLELENFNYYDYFFKEKIHFRKLTIYDNHLNYYKDKYVPSQDTTNSKGVARLYKSIQLDKLSILKNNIAFYDNKKDSVLFHIPSASLIMEGIFLDNKVLARKIPIQYKSVVANADSVHIKLNEFEYFKIAHIAATGNALAMSKLELIPKYDQETFSKNIPTERDHMRLKVDSVAIDSVDYGFKNSKFYVKIPEIIVQKPILHVFRDKTVADDLSIKPLYSEMIRDIPIDLDISQLEINNGNIFYEEKTGIDKDASQVQFNQVNGFVKNLSNKKTNQSATVIKLNSRFMNESPLNIDWSFKVQDRSDAFTFKATLGKTKAAALNTFTGPAVGTTFEGSLNKIDFTIIGNPNTATIDLKADYEDFKLIIMRKNKPEKKNKLLSFVANLIVRNDSETKESQFQQDTATVTRDKTKSVFNFIWIAVRNALAKVLT